MENQNDESGILNTLDLSEKEEYELVEKIQTDAYPGTVILYSSIEIAEHNSLHSHHLSLDQVDELIIMLTDARNKGYGDSIR